MLTDFFRRELEKYNTEELDPLGRQIIELFLKGAGVEEYMEVIPMRY